MEQKDRGEFQPAEVNPGLMEIVDYLRRLQPQYEDVLFEWREQVGKANRSCGLGAYILARLIHSEKPHLSLDGSVGSNIDPSEGIHLVFGLQKEGRWSIDHTWVEVVFDGQVLLISPESEIETSKTSFRASVFNLDRLGEVYEQVGLRRLSVNQNEINTSVLKEALVQVKKIVGEINHGEVPKVYKRWGERLLTRLQREGKNF